MKLKNLDSFIVETKSIPRYRSIKDFILIDSTTFLHYRIVENFIEQECEKFENKSREIFKDADRMIIVQNIENDKFCKINAKILLIKDSQKIDKQFSRLIEAWIKAKEKDIENTNSIPFGYGTRAYHRFKKRVFHADRVRERIRDFEKKYRPSEKLIQHAKYLHIL